ncbi:NADH dehydrogenase [ubiquinone] 1 beta subcomplex subunit 9 [Microplitis demolitor]|uniref:NADH dehydrogenase [ubiquinone] 1 beta subcomplex subunit 9 n=1 Tax=Microplitis demolitor TaxID=69319 RepID=UPI0004CD3067|nr:NADH dehydrogenase [ubiquinone] 1 beta subcomplex subunit 9 [Microplitis demolitor]
MAHAVPTGIRTHAQKVCSLYKRALRNYESWIFLQTDYRYEAVLLRARFDKNKDIKDLRVAKQLLKEGEAELEKIIHPSPLYFADSPNGVAYEREVEPPDWVLDYWHPTEKAMYPKYFALREKRKLEYMKLFDKQFPDAQKKFDTDH